MTADLVGDGRSSKWKILLIFISVVVVIIILLLTLEYSCSFDRGVGTWWASYTPSNLCSARITALNPPLSYGILWPESPLDYQDTEDCLKPFEFRVSRMEYGTCGIIYRDYSEEEFAEINLIDACWLISVGPTGDAILAEGLDAYHQRLVARLLNCLCMQNETGAKEYALAHNLTKNIDSEDTLCRD